MGTRAPQPTDDMQQATKHGDGHRLRRKSGWRGCWRRTSSSSALPPRTNHGVGLQLCAIHWPTSCSQLQLFATMVPSTAGGITQLKTVAWGSGPLASSRRPAPNRRAINDQTARALEISPSVPRPAYVHYTYSCVAARCRCRDAAMHGVPVKMMDSRRVHRPAAASHLRPESRAQISPY